jgi:hypothetical protein
MKKAIAGLLACVALAAGAGHAAAQGNLPITVGARLDAALPVGDFADSYEMGLGWAVDASFDVSPTFSLYGGYSRFELPVKGDTDTKAREDGAEFGGRLSLGTGGGVWIPFAQFGVLLHDETGFEVGLGADYPVSNSLSLTPLARFRKLGDAQYVAAGIGLRFRP